MTPDFRALELTSLSLCLSFRFLNSWRALAENDRLDKDSQLVDQTNGQKARNQDAAPEDYHVFSRLLLESLNLRFYVGFY